MGAAAATPQAGQSQPSPGVGNAPSGPQTAPSLYMPLTTDEEVHTQIVKDGISYVLESRSVSTVSRFIYTPIDGTFADLEVEINNMDPLLPGDGGGITVQMAGQCWDATTEDIERHFVSCEQVGDTVEARWQWKHGEELADFLFRFSISGKSLIVELEGGSGKATGVDLGCVSGLASGRLIEIPYLAFGTGAPRLLCTHGVFVSSFLDWQTTHASCLYPPDPTDAGVPAFRLNGGCTYLERSDGRRHSLRERWILSASRRLEEVLPEFQADTRQVPEELKSLLWFNINSIAPSEEGYVEIFEQLREFNNLGLDNVLVNHPDDVWHDGDGNATLHLTGAPEKGGDDALEEYLDAIRELGYTFSLPTDYTRIGTAHPEWEAQMAAQMPDGTPAPAGAGQYVLSHRKALDACAAHTRELAEKFKPPVLYVSRHAARPPWTFLDCAADSEGAASLRQALRVQRQLLADITASFHGPVIGDGGMHWLYPGLLHGHLARLSGIAPSHQPLLLDFALRNLHTGQVNAGLGSPEDFHGSELKEEDRNSRSALLDRYLATTIAFGHVGVLPDPNDWGLAAAAKVYYMLNQLQACYAGVPVESIHYHRDGNLLPATEAVVSGAYQTSQVAVVYANGLQVFVNGSHEGVWQIEHADRSYLLPPASFLASMPDGPLVYSADTGLGRIDMAQCNGYIYCDPRLNRVQAGPVKLEGAAVVFQRDWEIDVLPVQCAGEIEVDVSQLWPERRLPPLRVLAFKPEEEEGEPFRSTSERGRVAFEHVDTYCRYRITLPEWMVEPGR